MYDGIRGNDAIGGGVSLDDLEPDRTHATMNKKNVTWRERERERERERKDNNSLYKQYMYMCVYL